MMRSPLSHAPGQNFEILTPAQQFLVSPFERFGFVSSFITVTGLGWFFIWIVLRTAQDPLLPADAVQRGLLSAVVIGFVSGMVISAMQWLVLRRYLSDWLWILASATGYVLLTITLETWWAMVSQALAIPEVAALLERLSPIAAVLIPALIRAVLAAFSALWLGVAQWFLLRQYTSNSRWWIGVPSIAVLISSILVALGSSLATVYPIAFAPSVLAAIVLGGTQAIALCALQRHQSRDRAQSSSSLLATAPEILNYGQIQRLGRLLHRRLNLAWVSEHLHKKPLTYLVGITKYGAVAAFQPMHQAAFEQVDQVPLADLMDADLERRTGQTETLARFEVTFLPSGSLNVVSWRGFPLLWLAIGLLGVALLLSAIAPWLVAFVQMGIKAFLR